MNKKIGFAESLPVIKTVHFPKDKIKILLTDGRIILIPINKFPEIAKLKPSQKKKHKILAGMGLMFDDLDTVFHISDFIGTANNNYSILKYSSQANLSKVAEPEAKYHTRRRAD